MSDKKRLTKEGFEDLVEKFIDYAEEERDLALERYRRQDEMIESSEDFVIQGKNAVDFLKTAADRSNYMLNAAKMIKEFVADKDGGTPKGEDEINDAIRKQVVETLKNKK